MDLVDTDTLKEVTNLCGVIPSPFELLVNNFLEVYEARKHNEQVFQKLAFEVADTLTELKKVDLKQEKLQLNLHRLHAASNQVLDVWKKYSGRYWVLNWWFEKRTKEELKEAFDSLTEARSKLTLSMVIDLTQRVVELEKEKEKEKEKQKQFDQSLEQMSKPALEGTHATEGLSIEEVMKKEKKSRGEGRSTLTPLALAKVGKFGKLFKTHVEAKLKIPNRVDANEAGTVYTMLHQAVFWESVFGVAVLINHGANVNAPTGDKDQTLQLTKGSTPLHIAALLGNEALVRILLASGADPSICDEDGKSPAALNTSPSIKDLLTKHEDFVNKVREMYDAAKTGDMTQMLKLYVTHHLPLDVKAFPGREGNDFFLIHQVAFQGDLKTYQLLTEVYNACPLMYTMGKNGPRRLPSDVAREENHNEAADEMQKMENKMRENLAQFDAK